MAEQRRGAVGIHQLPMHRMRAFMHDLDIAFGIPAPVAHVQHRRGVRCGDGKRIALAAAQLAGEIHAATGRVQHRADLRDMLRPQAGGGTHRDLPHLLHGHRRWAEAGAWGLVIPRGRAVLAGGFRQRSVRGKRRRT